MLAELTGRVQQRRSRAAGRRRTERTRGSAIGAGIRFGLLRGFERAEHRRFGRGAAPRHIELWPFDRLVPYTQNVRTHSDEGLSNQD